MEGAALRDKKQLDVALFTAWHTAVFGLNGWSGKLKGKSLSDYIGDGSSKEADDGRLQHAKAISFFTRLQAKGLPIEISRNEIN